MPRYNHQVVWYNQQPQCRVALISSQCNKIFAYIQEIDDILASVKLLNCKSDLNITKSLITNSSTKLTTTGSESPIIIDSLGLSYEELLYLRQSTDCNDDFAQLLHEKGVNSKREKMSLLY